MLLLKWSLYCCVAPALLLAATFFLVMRWANARSRRIERLARAAAPRYLANAEPLTHDDLEMAVSDALRRRLQNYEFAHGKVVWNGRNGAVWDSRVAFIDRRGRLQLNRLKGDEFNFLDGRFHQLGRSYIVAFNEEHPSETKMINFVAAPPSCTSTRRGTA